MREGQREFGDRRTPNVCRRYCEVIDCPRYAMQYLAIDYGSGTRYFKRCHEHARTLKESIQRNDPRFVRTITKLEYLTLAEPWTPDK